MTKIQTYNYSRVL